MTNNLCIIPARGGSKRIPRKNIKNFLGEPIISYSIKTALESQLFKRVVVSTDDDEIAEIAIKYGADVPFLRSKDNSNDLATTVAVLHEVMSKLNQEFDYICCLYPTSPLTQIKHLKIGLDKLIQFNLDSVFPVIAFSYPVWRGMEIINDKAHFIWKEYLNSRSQDLKTVYHDAGQWYWFEPTKLTHSIFTDNSSAIILSEMEVQDIDNLTDWKMAEMKYELIQSIK